MIPSHFVIKFLRLIQLTWLSLISSQKHERYPIIKGDEVIKDATVTNISIFLWTKKQKSVKLWENDTKRFILTHLCTVTTVFKDFSKLDTLKKLLRFYAFSQIDIAKHYPSSLPTGFVVIFVECCFQNNKNKQKKKHQLLVILLSFSEPQTGGGVTHLQEANRDVPFDGVAFSRLE